ncbi:amino acid/amide ABC transporter membrane protein 2 (HAAT family) /amino acid/amide ABC transporter ATP-binding protein 1 (HAAT family) [Stella humosa]|uniref:Amino acid/amide ABC transporter membrane protein 2 (HAAT family) /amino acid/amide ABC transporter ATP-binding protein 1 (HAAT family) n=1 Tax=Stella humosa TaxID=94 RepID=A0A3N1KRH9_9PROT|nr:branched-chain amino acid ABC transporter ATP-binding protein/permease [Stella humosa]ROP83201.1 amino acid/amide ABC transporter membrane protein 2 (HAAT family) /amino acid/amide ABC transporter ATP-binding protein 1 (HAAT family) [Stella humosa]BBK30020.1 metal-dependent hydrolase [Stella humosa]
MTRAILWFAGGIRLPLIFAAGALVAFMLPLEGPYAIRLLTQVAIYALLGIGYQFVFGLAGAFSLAQGAFFGVGAYVAALATLQWDWTGSFTLPAAVLVALALATVVAVPVLRLSTHYFALATLGIAQVLLVLAIGWIDLTGGSNGLAGIRPLSFAGAQLEGWSAMVAVWCIAALAGLALYQIRRSLIGLAFNVLRTDPYAAVAAGVRSERLRFWAFLASAGLAGLAGALQVHTIGVVSPEVLDFDIMVRCLVICVVGGVARTSGAIIGAFLVVLAPELFQVLEGYRLLAFGALLLLAILFFPEGIVGGLEALRARWFGRPRFTQKLPTLRAPGRSLLATTRPVLGLERVSKNFGGVVAMESVTLKVGRGEIFGLIGPNGSGKSTLVDVVTGLTPADEGRVIVSGEDMTGRSATRLAQRGVARTFQTVHLHPQLTVLDNVAVARIGDLPGGLLGTLLAIGAEGRLRRARAEAVAILDALGLGGDALRPAGSLPPGAQRRLELARALARNPELILLDEPAAGLSEPEQAYLAERLRVFKTRGLAMVIVDHNLGFLLGLADRVACLDQGRLVSIGTPDQIRRDPAVIAAYIGRSAQPQEAGR